MRLQRKTEAPLRIWEEQGGKQKNGFLWMEGTALWLAMAAFWHGWMNVFEMGQKEPLVLAVLLVPVLWWTVVLLWKKMSALPLAGLAAAAVLTTAGWRQVWPGVGEQANGCIRAWNEYYNTSLPLFDTGEEPGIWGIVLLQFLLAGILAVVLKRKKGKIPAMTLLFFPVLLGATAGKLPDTRAFWLLLLAVVLYGCCCRKSISARSGDLVRAAGMVGILFLIALAGQSREEGLREEYGETWEQIRESLLEQDAVTLGYTLAEKIQEAGKGSVSGIGEGNLKNLAENQPLGTWEMDVTVTEEPRETLYLRAFTGAFYQGDQWEEPDERAFRAAMAEYDEPERTLWNLPFTRIQEGENLASAEIYMELEGASRSYGYTPYYSKAGQRDRITGDGALRGRQGKSRSYTFYYQEKAESLDKEELGEAPALWDAYQGYAKENYREVPEELEGLADYCRSFSGESIERLARDIQHRFSKELRYSRSPGETPSGEDVTEYFLLENKKGFCVHFATAAVLVYRECGFPARYVEGYAIPASDFVKQEDGTWLAHVTDSRAHAWAETFDPLLGWQVRDHTPGSWQGAAEETGVRDESGETSGQDEAGETGVRDESGGNGAQDTSGEAGETVGIDSQAGGADSEAGGTGSGAAASGQSSELSGEETGQEPGISQEESQGDGGQNLSEPAEKGGRTLLLSLLLAAAVLAGAGILLLVQRNVRRKIRLQRFRIQKGNQGIRCLYGEVCRICRFQGLEASPEEVGETAFLQMAKERFSQELEAGEWEKLSQCILFAAFSGEKVSRARQREMWQIYQKFRKNCLKNMKGRHRFTFLYIRAL